MAVFDNRVNLTIFFYFLSNNSGDGVLGKGIDYRHFHSAYRNCMDSLKTNGVKVEGNIPLKVMQNYYRPQTKFAKVMFSQLSINHSVHGGRGYLGRYPPWAGTPPGRYTTPWAGTPPTGTPPPGQVNPQAGTPLGMYTPGQVHPPPGRYTPPGNACRDTVNKRAVRIPLECILV